MSWYWSFEGAITDVDQFLKRERGLANFTGICLEFIVMERIKLSGLPGVTEIGFTKPGFGENYEVLPWKTSKHNVYYIFGREIR